MNNYVIWVNDECEDEILVEMLEEGAEVLRDIERNLIEQGYVIVRVDGIFIHARMACVKACEPAFSETQLEFIPDYGCLKDKKVEFDYPHKDGNVRHVTGIVRIEPNYPADDACLDVETADNWTEIFDKANICNLRVCE